MKIVREISNSPPRHGVTIRAVASIKWSALMEIVSRTAQPVIFVVLARLLTPADFGIVATVMIAISFFQMFWDAGLSKALVQTQEAPSEAAHVAFWTNLVLGILCYIALFIAAPMIAIFFNSPSSGMILRVLGVQIVIASLSSVQQALFVRDFDFRGLFWIRLLTASVPGLFSIPLALYGYGVWALVAGSLVGQILNSLLLWFRSSWRPRAHYDLILARKLLTFGFWILLGSIGSWLIMWSDSVIVGRYLGVHDLGVYRVAWSLVTVIYGVALNSFLPVLYPTFSRMKDDLSTMTVTFHKVNRFVISLSLPIGIGLLLIGPDLVSILFDKKWDGLGLVFGLLAFRESLSWTFGINGDLYKAMGRPDIVAKIEYGLLLLIIPVYFAAAQLGLEVFVWARMGVTMVGFLVHLCVCRRVLNVSRYYLWHQGKEAVLAAAAMGVLLWTIQFMPHVSAMPILPKMSLLIVAGCATYIAVLWLLDRHFIIRMYELLKRTAA